MSLRTQIIALVFSERTQSFQRALSELRRRVTGQPHIVSVFLELDDPYSYLLSQYLPDLVEDYDIELRLYLAQARGEAYRPRPDMLARYAERDCEQVARELGIPFLDRGRAPPVEHRKAVIDSLAGIRDSDQFGTELLECISLYWRGDAEAIARRVGGAEAKGEGDRLLDDGRKRLIRLGHYNTAMLHYGGEWYWGVDRLHHLTARLDALGQRKASAAQARLASIRQVMHLALPVTPPSTAQDLPPLEYFYSFRSPYSYLSLTRVFAIADAFGLELRIRPVLPMIMRGMQVPRPKLRYIGSDASREARRLKIPFGKFSDPLGKGVERCMAVFFYAFAEKRERDFLINAGEAVWARGINLATDKGMRKVTGRTGLFWPDVLEAMQDDSWRQEVEGNRASMEDSGSWGVPTLRMADFVVWGQDRDWLLVRHIEELCDTGEGILI